MLYQLKTSIFGCLWVSLMAKYLVTTLFHEPFGGAGGTTDADGTDAIKPTHVDFVGALYLMGVGVDAQTLVEKDLAVGTLSASNKED